MDWRERLIALFLYVNKHYDSELFIYTERMSNNSTPKFTDSELITVLHGSEFIRLIDSMSIMIAKAQRSGGAKVAREIAAKGHNSTKKIYYLMLRTPIKNQGVTRQRKRGICRFCVSAA